MEEQIEATETISIYVLFNICRRSKPERILPKTYSMRPLRMAYGWSMIIYCVFLLILKTLKSKYIL